MTCTHGFIGPCAECDGAGQKPPPPEPREETRDELVARLVEEARAAGHIQTVLYGLAGRAASNTLAALKGSPTGPGYLHIGLASGWMPAPDGRRIMVRVEIGEGGLFT